MGISNLAPLLVLGESTGVIKLETLDDFNAIDLSMVSQAKRAIRIFTQDLDHPLYDNDEFVDTIAEVARKHRYTLIQILVIDSSKAIKLGHRLVDLAKRLPSSVFIRKVHPDFADNNESFMLVDNKGLIRRPKADTLLGTAEFKATPSAQPKERYFMDVWERSSEDPSLRRLCL